MNKTRCDDCGMNVYYREPAHVVQCWNCDNQIQTINYNVTEGLSYPNTHSPTGAERAEMLAILEKLIESWDGHMYAMDIQDTWIKAKELLSRIKDAQPGGKGDE